MIPTMKTMHILPVEWCTEQILDFMGLVLKNKDELFVTNVYTPYAEHAEVTFIVFEGINPSYVKINNLVADFVASDTFNKYEVF